MVLPEIGTRGQQAFSEADVVIIGLGALGCVSADLLVRAGVGRVRLVDRDVVEMVNLQRQTLYSESDVDRPKAEAAAERLRRVNSSIRIDAVPRDVHSGTVIAIVEGANLIVDGTDNFETRFLLNEAALDRGMPFIYGGAIATYGMVLAIRSPDTACFRCFNPKALPPGSLPTCETAGIFNPVSAQVGALQAAEALRLLLGENPSGDLLVVDGWRPEIQRIHVARGTDCPACVGGDREYVGVRRTQVLASLCGSDTISLDPNHEDLIDLEGLRIRLEGLGQARRAAGVLVADVEGRRLTVFPDGRALIRGVRNESEARAVYAKYIGV
jgi:adenylyltransferase/sulfurtransferase